MKLKWKDALDRRLPLTIIGKRTPICKQHKQNNMKYVERQEWVERKIKQNHKQKQCPTCWHWFFKCDY